MVTSAEKALFPPEDYLRDEECTELKHEYLDGEVWAMVGATDFHVTIAMNLAYLLKANLKDTPYQSYISDMKVHVEKANAFFYPDVLVTCDKKDKQSRLYKQSPIFIAEVLSPSTEAYDRGLKFSCYRQLESLKEYWLIDTQKIAIDTFRRNDDNDWVMHSYSEQEQNAMITSLDLTFPLGDLYEDVELDIPH